MKTIAYYISDYGYGHASRSISVIRELLKEPEVNIIICHSFALLFLQQSLQTDRVRYRNVKTDVGYFLQKDSIYPDKERLLVEYQVFVDEWDQRIDTERTFLRENQVDLVVSDISPLPFEATASLGIPSVGVSNFTWYTAYQGLIHDQVLQPFHQAYQKMTYFFSLAGSFEQRPAVKTKQYGFFAREVDRKEVRRIRQLADPSEQKKVIFLGLGMKIDVATLQQLPIWDSPNCVFLVSSNVEVNRPNVFSIPADYIESQHYLAAADLVISKAGWGMVGEAVSAMVPLLILDRPSMKEDQNTIRYLKQHQLCETIEWEAFQRLQVDVDRMKASITENPPGHMSEAGRIAVDLLEVIE